MLINSVHWSTDPDFLNGLLLFCCMFVIYIHPVRSFIQSYIIWVIRGGYKGLRCDFCCLSNSNLGGSHSSSIGENCNISFFPPTDPFIYFFFLIFSLLSGWQVSGGFFLRLTSLWVCVRLTKDPTMKKVEIAFSFSLWAQQFPPGCPALPTRWENRIYKYRMEACRDQEKSRDECKLKCVWVGTSAHPDMYSENISVCRIFPILTYFPGHTPLFSECEMTSGMLLKLSVPSSWVNTPCIHHHLLLLEHPSLCWLITRDTSHQSPINIWKELGWGPSRTLVPNSCGANVISLFICEILDCI